MNRRVVAIRRRDMDGVEYEARDGDVPQLDELVRDYVDGRKVHHGMVVLRVQVEDGEVESVTVNTGCANRKAWRIHDSDANIEISAGV